MCKVGPYKASPKTLNAEGFFNKHFMLIEVTNERDFPALVEINTLVQNAFIESCVMIIFYVIALLECITHEQALGPLWGWDSDVSPDGAFFLVSLSIKLIQFKSTAS